MSDDKKTEKKGFFSRIFGGLTGSSESDVKEKSSVELPSPSAIKAMKKADIVSTAKEHGLELDISNTKAQLLESWKNHFSNDDSPSAVDDAAEAMAESAAKTSESIEEAPVEEAPAEEAPVEEAPVEEEAPAEEAPVEEEQSVKVSLEEKTPAQIIKNFETKQLKEDTPDFRPGDTVAVSVKVKEGDRVRLQVFEGVVMGIKNAGLNSSFIVRKISSGIGVERTFQLHSPMIESILVKRKGDVRQAKLFYLRERSGKSARIKERLD